MRIIRSFFCRPREYELLSYRNDSRGYSLIPFQGDAVSVIDRYSTRQDTAASNSHNRLLY